MDSRTVMAHALNQGVAELSFKTAPAFPYSGEFVTMFRLTLDETERDFAPAGVISEYVVIRRVWGTPDRVLVRTYDRGEAYGVFTGEACETFTRSVRSACEDVDGRAVNHPLHMLRALITTGQSVMPPVAQGGDTPMVVDIPPHVYSVGTAPALVNLVKTEAAYRVCGTCSVGYPLYRAVWGTPGAWWGETYWERYCYSCLHGRGAREGWAIPRPSGVSLRKSGDRAGFDADVELCAPYGDGSAPAMRVNLARTSCDWCEGEVPAFFSAVSVTGDGVWIERFCGHHALRFGSFRPVGFVESV